MDRIAAIKKLQKIANLLDEQGMTSEATIIDQVSQRVAGIQDEGGLQGNYAISPGIANDLGNYDPYSLGDLNQNHVTENPGFGRAENMIEGELDPSFGESIFEDEDESLISPEEREMRELALQWSSGQDTALYTYAYSGTIYILDQQKDLLHEIDEAIEFNNDPEQHLALQSLRMHVLDEVPILTPQGFDNVEHVDMETQPDSQPGVQRITMTFETKNGSVGVVTVMKYQNSWTYLNAFVTDANDNPVQMNWDQNAGMDFVSALYDKMAAKLAV